MDEQTIDFRDIFALLGRNFFKIIIVLGLFVSVAFLLAKYLPKQYKAKAIVNIHASYFQNPLVNSVVSDVFDPNEIKGQRQALLQQALSVDFIEDLGNKFKEYKPNVSRKEHAAEREYLAKRIEMYGMGASAFQISVTSNKAQKSLAMIRTVLAQMEKVVLEQRSEALRSTRQAIEKQVTDLEKVLEENDADGVGRSSDKVKAEIEKKENEINALLQHFTDKHPEVIKLRSKIKLLKRQYEAMPKGDKTPTQNIPKVFKSDYAQKSVKEQYDDLLKKLINIDIVLDRETGMDKSPYFVVTEQPSLPSKPSFPNQQVFLLFGIVGGLLCAGVLVAFAEFKRGTFISPYYISDQLDMPLLGELPYGKEVSQSVQAVGRLEYKRTRKLLTAGSSDRKDDDSK